MGPTTGRVAVNGRISSLLELGAGFNPEFTGRENVELYGIVMGMTREETLERMPVIQAFAGIGDFIDRPVKSYLERHVRAARVFSGDPREPGRPAR